MKKFSFRYILFLVTGTLIACEPQIQEDVEVHFQGELRKIMHENDISAKVDLDTLQKREHLYAIGALDSLKGEILVENGVPYMSTIQNDLIRVLKDFDHRAALLVYTEVAEWKKFDIPDSVKSMKGLELYLSEMMKKSDQELPFPFRLEGEDIAVEYHIIQPLKQHNATHEAHRKAGYQGQLKGEMIYITGFYSNNHHGIFTHHDSNLHMHVRNQEADEVGHVDGLTLGKNVKLFIPVSL